MNPVVEADRNFVWHPYAAKNPPPAVVEACGAGGTSITLEDGRVVLDGISSWWCMAHGHRHPAIIGAVERQLHRMPHVMFAGFTHEPAALLAAKIASMTPGELNHVFYLDSGSVAVEAALKMALQYQHARGKGAKNRFLTFLGGYHGDTLGAMALCDPEAGMHGIFQSVLVHPVFAPKPVCRFDGTWDDSYIAEFERLLAAHHQELAAVIVEPIFQGASSMNFYSPVYLKKMRALCNHYDVLLIFDEIATGFGRTGALFACNHADVAPDIICIGKALTGGVITLAACVTTPDVSDVISQGSPGVFLHGPTFMANPLACAAANASLDLFGQYDWLRCVGSIEATLKRELAVAGGLHHVSDVRALGAIGVIEFDRPLNGAKVSQFALSRGVWLRPFDRYLYTMPPFVMPETEVVMVGRCMVEITERIEEFL